MEKKCFFITAALLVFGAGTVIAGGAEEIGALIKLGAVIVDTAVQSSNNSSSGSSSSGNSYGGSSGQTYTYYITAHRFTGGGIDTTNCYSGIPKYKNQPQYCDKKDEGPIPTGTYYITGVRHKSDGAPSDWTLVLTPDPSTEMYRRNNMRIHGGFGSDNQTASTGCIVLEDRNLREKIANAYYNSGNSVVTLYVYE